MFLNEHEIDEACRLVDQYRSELSPALVAAAETLSNLRHAVNRNSDGWPYWNAPQRASQRLQALVSEIRPALIECKQVPDAWERYKAAQTQLKRFRTKTGLDFAIVRGI